MDRWHLGFNDDRLLVYNVSGFSFRAKMNCMSGLDLVDIYFTAFLDCDLKLSHKKIAFFVLQMYWIGFQYVPKSRSVFSLYSYQTYISANMWT